MTALGVFLESVDRGSCGEVTAGPATAAAYQRARSRGEDLPDKIAVGHEEGVMRRFWFDQPNRGDVFVDLDRAVVHKRITGLMSFGVVEREARWLTRLSDSGCTPTLIRHGGDEVVLGYLGEPLRHHNLPPDWMDQAETILGTLRAASCAHNDIKCDNLVVADGRLSLIDFGWATVIGEPIPGNWPRGLGRQHRLDVHRFDDRHAIHAACRSAEANRVEVSKRSGRRLSRLGS